MRKRNVAIGLLVGTLLLVGAPATANAASDSSINCWRVICGALT